jgi:hypothetical protein
MKVRTIALLSSVAAAATPVFAQTFGAAGFVTVSMAGLGNTTTVAGDARIPVLTRDIEYNAGAGNLHLRATGHRGAVRQLDIRVHAPHTGARFELGSGNDSALHVNLEDGAELVAESGHGFIEITTLDDHHVTGSYEGTFNHGAVPIVLRGRFDANLPRASGAPSSAGASGQSPH